MKKLWILIFVCNFSFLDAQESWENISKEEVSQALNKIKEFYKTHPNFSLQLSHASYADYKSVSTYEKMNGFVKKSGDSYISLMMGIKIIQNKKIKISIDSSSKIILIGNSENDFNVGLQKDQEEALSICKSFSTRNIAGEIEYKFEYPDYFTYNSSIIRVTKDGRLSKIILFFNKKEHTDENGKLTYVQPRAEIDYWNFKVENLKDSEFSTNQYIIENAGNYKLTPNFREFKLQDLRTKK